MAKIERLTPEQEAYLPVFRQRYLDIATGGGRIDRPALEAAMAEAYAVIGKDAPKVFIFDSPAECLMAMKIFQMGDNKPLWANLKANLKANLGDNLRANLGANLRDNLWDNLRDNLWGNLRDNLMANLGDNLRDNLGANLKDNLWDNLRDNLWDNLWDNLRANLGDTGFWNHNFLWGSQDFYWISYYRFAQKIGCVFNEGDTKRLDIMEAISSQCEWWWPFDGIVFVSQRPKVYWDGEGRIHREDGPAVEYKGGYGLSFWRGTCIPNEWIAGGPPEADKIMSIPNTEQRRVACEMRGWQNVIPCLPDAELVDKSPNPQIGELWQATLPDHGKDCFLIVPCGTGRTFGMPVGPKFKTAREANAATYGIAPQLLDNLQFRT